MAISAEDVFARSMTPAERAEAAQRGEALALQYLTLQQLRRARHLTQEQLAAHLGKNQAQISQIEKRADMLLSTLRSYVEAMGGSLRLVVQFEDGAPIILHGLTDDEPTIGASGDDDAASNARRLAG